MEICKSTTQLISGLVRVKARLKLYGVHDYWRADRDEVTAFVVNDGMIVQSALQSAGCIICRRADQSITNFGCLTVYGEP